MLSCAEFLAEFGDYLENSVGSEVKARIEGHLRECNVCQVILDSTRKSIKIVTESDSFTLPDDAVEPIVREVMARIHEKKP
jgi:predicted anti-sigma-YlaC factor YlaD